MNETHPEYEELFSNILEALTFLDQKGTNESVTQAITIVYEGFRRQAASLPFTGNDLFMSALVPK